MEHPICQLYKSLYGEKFLYDLLIQDKCEVDYEFPGFMDFYYHLSQIIPYDHTVLDLGCYIGLQSIYFRNHIFKDHIWERWDYLHTCPLQYDAG